MANYLEKVKAAKKVKIVKKTDYLYASARIKAIELKLLSRDKLLRLSDAKSPEDALKMLSEFGWPEITKPNMAGVEEALASRRGEAFALVRNMIKDKRLTDIFLVKYDYHNVKTLLKSEATGDNPDNLLIESGNIPVRQLKVMLQEDKFQDLSKIMVQSIADAREMLGKTQDPQLLDMILDKAMYADMLGMANPLYFKFLKAYVVLMIDSVNLRTLVRSKRMGKGLDVLRHALVPGGSIPLARLMADEAADNVEHIFRTTSLAAAAQAGALALRGEGTLQAVDMACDNALLKYAKAAKYIPYGAEPIIGYLVAVEAELTSVRTVIAGRMAGLSADTITERLRETYV